jgi:hypothetical protein
MTGAISIIGAAIAGPAAALALADHGYDVTVYEAKQPGDLVSAGIVGVTRGVWGILQDAGVDVDRYELDHDRFEITDLLFGEAASPYRAIPWYGLHDALVERSEDLGARYVWGRHLTPGQIGGQVFDATGIAGAARYRLPYRYAGKVIYQGMSPMPVGRDFEVYRPDGPGRPYLTIGDVPGGSFWAYFAPRPEPSYMATMTVPMPAEFETFPAHIRRVMRVTPTVWGTPLMLWHTPAHISEERRRVYKVGDVNGPIWAVTTAGANLAVIEGFRAPDFMVADDAALGEMERAILKRRQDDLDLGPELDGPEIGGVAEDRMFAQHHALVFGGGYE